MKSPLLSALFLGVCLAAPTAQSTAQSACTDATVQVRTEWGSLTAAERRTYIESVQCLMDAPSQIPAGVAPGAVSRYDDFIASHINSTLRIHINGVFLLWHRHYVHLFEAALREECNFHGAIPYFNWALYADGDILASPLLDGSDTSFGGDGAPDPSVPPPANGNYTAPPGNGGGCITNGPFANLQAPFRNFAAPVTADGRWQSNGGVPPADGLQPAPHCVRRNINPTVFRNSNAQANVDRLLAQPDIVAFQRLIDFSAYPEGSNSPDFAIHVGGHFGFGPDMSDFFASPSDPVFYLHHGMLDHLYAQWQAADWPVRRNALNGTDLLFNDPAGEEVSLDTMLDFYSLGQAVRLGDLTDTTAGPYCYRYDRDV